MPKLNRFSALAGVLAALLSTPVSALADEVFECKDTYAAKLNENAPVLVVATVNDDGKTGEIRAAGMTEKAEYRLDGLNRTWIFSGSHKLTIEPNGNSYYQPESGVAQSYTCKKTS